MTRPAPATSSCSAVIARVALNYPLIHARAAELGLTEPVFTELVGTSLATLRSDHSQRTLSLTMLVRLARLLEISLDELVLTDAVPAPPPRSAGEEPGPGADAGEDATVVLALLATYSGLPVAHTLRLLGWTRARLDDALAGAAGQLRATALRVAVTDERLQLLLRPGALPADVRERFDRDRVAQQPLEPHLAVVLLALVRDEILAPFPDQGDDVDATQLHRTNVDPALLLARRIAVRHTPISPDQQHDLGLRIHPDIMFALRLADEPDCDATPRVAE
ncbi:hypothetical protein [Amycolatopsis magusensis]|uniref:hypothetical protein n=1 Tax=Amycolatopsis magusensis TaxID=882444 RepID=UPI0024A89187|nr:hypothetical protein [Amycolatopsis magusensis]MDI5978244.1 hypothetical protein [Amycolatopsis magusensis]